MGTDIRLITGQVAAIESSKEETDVQALLLGFLKALVEEQKFVPDETAEQ